MHKQDINYWNSIHSIKRYSKIEGGLIDIELSYISKAAQYLGKPIKKIRILDLGCGAGRTTVPLYKMGFDITGLDIAKNLIKSLKDKYPQIKAEVGDATMLKYPDNYFDIVLFSHNSIDCIYPYSSRIKSIKEINRVLVKGGYFVFSSHVFNFIPYDLDTLRNILVNIPRFPTLIGSGYYTEYMNNGMKVQLYSARVSKIRKELIENNFILMDMSRITVYDKNLIMAFLRGMLNWERYYIAKKNVL